MNAEFGIAPIADAWDNFHATSRIGHIADDQDYEVASGLADELLDEGAMEDGHPRHSLFMMLSDLIYAYDQRHYPMPSVQGVQVLRFLMDQHGLKQTQIPEIGGQSVVSEILAGKRSLTVDHIRNLSERFGISPNSFF